MGPGCGCRRKQRRLPCLERSEHCGSLRPAGVILRQPFFLLSGLPDKWERVVKPAALTVKFMDKTQKINDLVKELIREEFTGSIRINFNQGGITRIEKIEEILKKTLKTANLNNMR